MTLTDLIVKDWNTWVILLLITIACFKFSQSIRRKMEVENENIKNI